MRHLAPFWRRDPILAVECEGWLVWWFECQGRWFSGSCCGTTLSDPEAGAGFIEANSPQERHLGMEILVGGA